MKNHFYVVISTYSPNSAATNRTLSYLKAWKNKAVEVTVVYLLPDRKFSQLQINADNIKVLHLWKMIPIKNYFVHNVLYFLYVVRLLCMLNKHETVFVYGQSYLLNWLLLKKRIIIYQERNEHPLAVSLGRRPYRVSINNYLKNCRRISGMFVISTGLKSYFVDKGVEESKIHIINMTVDPARFVGISKKNQKRKYIAYCGTASNNKDGVDQLIKSFAIVSHRYPNLYLYIIGQIPNKNEKNNNVQLAEQLGVSEKVFFTGVIPRQEMPQLLVDATILALDRPDNLQAKHGFPTKLGEYLLTGNPVVVTAVGDIPRFIKNGVSGMLAEPDNSKDFAKKIEWLLENPTEAAKIGQEGKRVALANFNNEVEAQKIIDVIFKK